MNRIASGALIGVAAATIAGASFHLGRHAGSGGSNPPSTGSDPASVAAERKVLYWHDPMVPAQRFDKPGKSPFMDMQLVPVYADEASDSGVKVSSAVQQNLGLRLATVRRADVSSSFDAVGTVQFDERLTVAVQTRVAGYVERLAVRAPMERVRKGQALAALFAPDWLGPQSELLALERAGVAPDIIAAARDRMRAMSIPEELIRRSEKSGTAQARFTLRAPASGVVAELGVREGVAVTAGMTLFRIAGLERVWAVAEVPEAEALRLTRGHKVKAALQADASLTFAGELKEILPQVSAETRTLQARFEVDNSEGRLMPGMLLRLQVAGPARAGLVVPSEAVIRTGKRALVIVRNGDGTFEPRDIALGTDMGDEVETVRGLSEGDRVVASGQFLIDSEARLRSVLGNMTSVAESMPTMAAPAAASIPGSASAIAATLVHVAQGTVESVGADNITISHGPVASLNWPPMTMGFGKPSPHAYAEIKPGDRVRFEFKAGGPAGYELLTVKKTGVSK